MKKIILGSVLGLMSMVAFAQNVPNPTTTHHPVHTKAEWQEAREACKTQVMSSKPADKKTGHEAFRQCMESKGFKHHPRNHEGKTPVDGKPMPPVAQPAPAAPATK